MGWLPVREWSPSCWKCLSWKEHKWAGTPIALFTWVPTLCPEQCPAHRRNAVVLNRGMSTTVITVVQRLQFCDKCSVIILNSAESVSVQQFSGDFSKATIRWRFSSGQIHKPRKAASHPQTNGYQEVLAHRCTKSMGWNTDEIVKPTQINQQNQVGLRRGVWVLFRYNSKRLCSQQCCLWYKGRTQKLSATLGWTEMYSWQPLYCLSSLFSLDSHSVPCLFLCLHWFHCMSISPAALRTPWGIMPLIYHCLYQATPNTLYGT